MLGGALASILGQTFGDFELLVVDDASTDETEALVRGLADERVHYQCLPVNSGQAAARNAALQRARGELLAFLDSDDRFAPDKLARFVGVLRQAPPNVGCVYSDMRYVRLDGTDRYFNAPRTIERGRLIDPATGWYQTSRVSTQSAMVRRQWLDAVGPFDEALRCYEDMEFFLRLSMVCDFVHIDTPLTHYHESTGSTIRDQRSKRRARQHMLRRHGRAIAKQSPGFVIRECLGIARARLRG